MSNRRKLKPSNGKGPTMGGRILTPPKQQPEPLPGPHDVAAALLDSAIQAAKAEEAEGKKLGLAMRIQLASAAATFAAAAATRDELMIMVRANPQLFDQQPPDLIKDLLDQPGVTLTAPEDFVP
jgi:hypothetical protein